MEDLTSDITLNELTLRQYSAILDHRMPWYTLRYGPVSAVRIDAHSYPHALHLAITFLQARG
jgi:hypothetical protein